MEVFNTYLTETMFFHVVQGRKLYTLEKDYRIRINSAALQFSLSYAPVHSSDQLPIFLVEGSDISHSLINNISNVVLNGKRDSTANLTHSNLSR